MNCAPVPPPSGSVITPADLQGPRSVNDTAEYRANYTAKEYVNNLYAIDNGWDGDNVLVGVIDDGAKAVGDLTGQISTLSKDFGTVTTGGVATSRNVIGDDRSEHGTAVASIIAGRRDGTGSMGYAPDARIVALRVDDYTTDNNSEIIGRRTADAIDYSLANNVKVINRSLNSMGPTTQLQEAVARMNVAGAVLVNSTGNDGASNPNDVVNVTDANRTAWLFVGALTANGDDYSMAAYSNRCGIVMDRCVVAPGVNTSTRVDGGLGIFIGTSSAAPVVSGLVATILDKWPQLTGVQAADVVLSTARDLGAPGMDAVYGMGLVDFQRALSPVNPTLSNGSRQSSLGDSFMALPGAMGNGGGDKPGSIESALSNVTVLDAFGRDFTGNLAGGVVRTGNLRDSYWLQRRMAYQGGSDGGSFAMQGFGGSFGYVTLRTGPGEDQKVTRMTNADFAVRQGKTTYRASFNSNDSIQNDVMGLAPTSDLMLAYAPAANASIGISRDMGNGSLGLTMGHGNLGTTSATTATLAWNRKLTSIKVGLVDEKGSLFGTPTGNGALNLAKGSSTLTVEGSQSIEIGANWTLSSYASLGFTKLKMDAISLLTDASLLTTARLGFLATGNLGKGLLSLGLAQPLTVLSGEGTMTVGDGYDLASRSLTYARNAVDFRGQERVELTVGYEQVGKRSSLRVGATRGLRNDDVTSVATWNLRI